jgi:hypothetical protein
MKANPSKRDIQHLHVMCAGLKPGTDKIHNCFGNGDCMMADFTHNPYAVSDETDYFQLLTAFRILCILWEQAGISASGNHRDAALARVDNGLLQSS